MYINMYVREKYNDTNEIINATKHRALYPIIRIISVSDNLHLCKLANCQSIEQTCHTCVVNSPRVLIILFKSMKNSRSVILEVMFS